MAAIQIEHDEEEDSVFDSVTVDAQQVTDAAAFGSSAAGAVASGGAASSGIDIEEPEYGDIGDEHDGEVCSVAPAVRRMFFHVNAGNCLRRRRRKCEVFECLSTDIPR
jgi:hypothetical protein